MRGTVRKRGSSYQVIVNVTGPDGVRRQTTGTRKTKREADELLLRMLADAGQLNAGALDATVGDLLSAWQTFKAPGWRPSNERNTRDLVERYLRPKFGRTKLRKLRTADLDLHYANLLASGGKKGKPLSPATVRRIHTVMRSALAQAVRWEWIADNPATRVDTSRIASTGERITPPAAADVARLIAGADKIDEDFGVWLRIAAATGARRGEVCALRWSAVDLDTGAVRIDRALSLGDTVVEGPTKTGNRRTITLDPVTLDVLRAHRRRCAERSLSCGAPLSPDGYVFSLEPDGVTPWRPDLPTHRFGRLRRELGLKGVRLHDLRHFHATTLLNAGMALPVVAGRLGHGGGGRTTLAVYGHGTAEMDGIAAAVWAEVFERATSPAAAADPGEP